jgi:LmbE family N-acetylglucosaminyl deacetylase
MKRSILLVFAHPDDESFGVSGTVAKYVNQDIPVDLITATKGEKGTRVDMPDNTDTATVREAELRAAAAIIGIRAIHFLGYIDGELDKADPDEVTRKVLAIMRRLQPEVVITFAPDGITGHPDHVAISAAATRAFELYRQKAGGQPRLYYHILADSAVPDASEMGVTTHPDEQVTTAIDVSDYLDIKIKAVAAHRSQQDARDFVEMLKESVDSPVAAEEHFLRVNARGSGKETDLFS